MELENEVFCIVLSQLLEQDANMVNEILVARKDVQLATEHQYLGSDGDYLSQLQQLAQNPEKCKKIVSTHLLELGLREPVLQNISLLVPEDSMPGESSMNMSGINISKMGSTARSPKFSQVVGTSVVSTVYQRPTSVLDGHQTVLGSQSHKPRSSSISQARNVTMRQDIDKQTLQNKITATQRQLDKSLAKLETVKMQLQQRKRTLDGVTEVNRRLVAGNAKGTAEQERAIADARVQAERLEYYKERIEACRQCVHRLATQHPEYRVMIHGKDVPAQIQCLFDQLIRLSLQRIYEASKTATIKVYEQEVNLVSDNEALAAAISELKGQKLQLERKLRQVKDQYHRFVIDQQKGKSLVE